MKTIHPPKLAEGILKLLTSSRKPGLLGDTAEEYGHILKKNGRLAADIWYIAQVFLTLPFLLRSTLSWGFEMFRNHLKITRRIIKKHVGFSFINIAGLALGMTCCIVILLFVQEEMSFDRFHKKADSIHRIGWEFQFAQELLTSIRMPSWIAPGLIEDFPEVEDAARLVRWAGVVGIGQKRFEERIFFADPSFLKIFSFPLLKGDTETALSGPSDVVITEEFAKKYFGSEDPVGQTLTVDGQYDFRVTGVLADIPKNSHVRFDFLGHFGHVRNIYGERRFDAQSIIAYTYILLNDPAAASALDGKLEGFLAKKKGEKYAADRDIYLQPLTSIHLGSHESVELGKNSHASYSYALSIIAFVIILIACINYINLSTARASKRSLEVGVRKAVGAGRRQLFFQFIGESLLMSFLAVVLSVFMAMLLLPFFNSVMEREVAMDFQGNLLLYLGLLGLAILVGLASGCYPALYLSSFSPVSILKGKGQTGRPKGLILRKVLVVFQFGLASAFIISTLIVSRQIGYIQDRDLGFETDRIYVLPPPLKKDDSYDAFKADLLSSPFITDVTSSTGTLGSYSGFPFSFFGGNISKSEAVPLAYMSVDYDFFRFYDIKFIEGRDFSALHTMDSGHSFILNESAVKKLGWETAVGKKLTGVEMEDEAREVIGVVKDFHNISMHEEIKPAVYHVDPLMFGEMTARAAPGKAKEALAFLKEKWNKWAPTNIFYYHSLGDQLDALYREDQKVSRVFVFASILTVFISSLGLLGLSIFESEQRVKEIGIRKVLGASLPGILRLLSRDFGRLVLLANLAAWPVVYYLMSRWLSNFAYHTDISLWLFAAGGGLTIMVAAAAISFQTIKTAFANPVDSIRYE
ncbi:ABC transporter permease [Acidobacteriota bacterium]